MGSFTRSVTDKVNGASSVCFDGNGYLQVDATPDFVFAGDLTIDFWFKSSYPVRQHALSFGEYAVDNLEFDFVDSSGFMLYWNSSGANKITSGTLLQYVDGRWHHVAMVRGNGVITAYMDGVAVGKTAYPAPIGSATQPVRIGAVIDDGIVFNSWHGCIDDLRVINGRALWSSDFDPFAYLPPPLNAHR